MKTLHSFFTFALAMLVSLSFVACGGDDDPTTPTPPPTPTPSSKIDIPTTENTKPVFSTEGGTATIKFTASQAWTASATNDRASEWLTVSPSSGSAGSSTLTITTKDNDTYDERSASITIKSGTASQTIVVTQKQKDALLVTSDKYEVDAEGGEISVEVKSNIDYSVKTDADWISQNSTRALNTANLTFVIGENTETTKREGHITISSGEFSETVTIYQAGNSPTIIISQNEYSISSEGGEISVEVRSNVDVSVSLPEVGWINESSTRSMSTHTYVFAISKNEGYDARSAEILFTNKANNLSEKITITQMQQDAIIVAKDKYEIEAKGGSLEFEVQTNVDFETSVDANWITKADTRALHSEKLSFNIKANDTYEDRSATITITGMGITQKVSVIQHGLVAVTSIELDKTSLEISVGSSAKLTATVYPSNADNKSYTFSSSNTDVATVNENGIINALKEGEAIINATTIDGKKTASCKVIVSKKSDIVGVWENGNYFLSLSKDGFLTSYFAERYLDSGDYTIKDDKQIICSNLYYAKPTYYNILSVANNKMTVSIEYVDVNGNNQKKEMTFTKSDKDASTKENPLTGKIFTTYFSSTNTTKVTYSFNTYYTGTKTADGGTMKKYPMAVYYIYFNNRLYFQTFKTTIQMPSIGGWIPTTSITVWEIVFSNDGSIKGYKNVSSSAL